MVIFQFNHILAYFELSMSLNADYITVVLVI